MSLESAKACASFGRRLTALREARGWTKCELARRLDEIDHANVSNWERRKRLPGFEKLLMLSEVFGVTLDELMRGKAE